MCFITLLDELVIKNSQILSRVCGTIDRDLIEYQMV